MTGVTSREPCPAVPVVAWTQAFWGGGVISHPLCFVSFFSAGAGVASFFRKGPDGKYFELEDQMVPFPALQLALVA